MRKEKVVYFIRHAEAFHNIKEREAVEHVKKQGFDGKAQEAARKAVLQDESLKDAPLSQDGEMQARQQSNHINILHKISSNKYPPPELVLVSPLRRALMTATELFHQRQQETSADYTPEFVSLEAIREKRTGYAADERSSVDILEKEFGHVDFTDLKQSSADDMTPTGEDNDAVRKRGRKFLDDYLPHIFQESVAVVTHKGWLREFRKTLQTYVEAGQLQVDFDLEHWHNTLYKNAEIRVAKFIWEEDKDDNTNIKLVSIVSRSVENAMGSVIENAVKHLIEQQQKSILMMMQQQQQNQENGVPSVRQKQLLVLKKPSVTSSPKSVTEVKRVMSCPELLDSL